MNTITIELCPEDRGRLDALITELRVSSDTLELIRLALTNAGTPFPAVAAEQPEPEAEEIPGQMSIDDGPAHAEESTEEVQPQVYKVSLADIQKKVVGLSTKGKKDAVKAIVQAYAPKVSAIPEDKLEEVVAKLVELEG